MSNHVACNYVSIAVDGQPDIVGIGAFVEASTLLIPLRLIVLDDLKLPKQPAESRGTCRACLWTSRDETDL